MTTMTDTEWQSFVTAGTKLAHVALSRRDGRPHVTPVCFILDGDEGEARISAEPDDVRHIGVGIARRYYATQPTEDVAESFVQAGFSAVRISVTNVIARSGLGT